jgi:hypothetical protein
MILAYLSFLLSLGYDHHPFMSGFFTVVALVWTVYGIVAAHVINGQK